MAPVEQQPRLADIVIPVYGALDKLDLCLAALHEQRVSEQANVYIVDDAGPQPAKPVADKYGFRCIRRDKNGGFAETCNLGASLGRAPYIVFMNSDIVVTPGWLEAMISEFANPRVAVVGAKLLFPEGNVYNFPPGSIQHAGMVFEPGYMPRHRFLGWSADHPRANRKQVVQAVTGGLMAVRRSVWQQIGGFNPMYGMGTFEDTEFCIMATHLKYFVLYTPFAVAYHYTGSSAIAAQQKFPMRENFALFCASVGKAVNWDEWFLL